MSVSTSEEDTELRDLVAATLQQTGILGNIKAQLRANVYTALEQGEAVRHKSSQVNRRLQQFLSTTTGRLVASLVREFLDFFELSFTLAVFDPETNIGKDFKHRERSKLIEALGLTELVDREAPLLCEVMRLSKVSVLKSESPTLSEASSVEEDQHTSAPVSLADDRAGQQDTEPASLSDNSDSKTPRIPFNDPSVNLVSATKNYGGKKLGSLESPMETKPSDAMVSEIAKSKDSSFLSDLPPLGGMSMSSLGSLPPLTAGVGKALAPLSMKGKKKSSLFKEASNEGSESDSGKKSNANKSSKPDSAQLGPGRTDEARVRSPDPSSRTGDISENIEEDLDSLLNSELSGGELTRDETVKEDQSLKADYMESL